MEQPKPLGLVVVAAGGVPARATANMVDPTMRVAAQSFTVQAHPGNTGLIYVRMGAQGDDRVVLRHTIGIIAVPVSATQGPFPQLSFSKPVGSAGFNMASIYIDAGVNGNGAIVTCVEG